MLYNPTNPAKKILLNEKTSKNKENQKNTTQMTASWPITSKSITYSPSFILPFTLS